MERFNYKGVIVEVFTRNDPSDWVVTIQRPGESKGSFLPLAEYTKVQAMRYAKGYIDREFARTPRVLEFAS